MTPHGVILDIVRRRGPVTPDRMGLGPCVSLDQIQRMLEDLERTAQIRWTGQGWEGCVRAVPGRPGHTPWQVVVGNGGEHVTSYIQIGDALVRATGRGRTVPEAIRRCSDLCAIISTDPEGWLQRLADGRA